MRRSHPTLHDRRARPWCGVTRQARIRFAQPCNGCAGEVLARTLSQVDNTVAPFPVGGQDKLNAQPACRATQSGLRRRVGGHRRPGLSPVRFEQLGWPTPGVAYSSIESAGTEAVRVAHPTLLQGRPPSTTYAAPCARLTAGGLRPRAPERLHRTTAVRRPPSHGPASRRPADSAVIPAACKEARVPALTRTERQHRTTRREPNRPRQIGICVCPGRLTTAASNLSA